MLKLDPAETRDVPITSVYVNLRAVPRYVGGKTDGRGTEYVSGQFRWVDSLGKKNARKVKEKGFVSLANLEPVEPNERGVIF